MDLSPDLADRLARAQAGEDVSKRLRIGALEVGDWGVIRAMVTHIHPPRTFQRKRGGEGSVGRVTLDDGSGEIDLVLWDGEIDLCKTDLAHGNEVTLRGATVKAGWKGGLELGLGSAVIEATRRGVMTIEGTIEALGDTELADGRFKAEVRLDGQRCVVLWDENVKHARGLGIGAAIRLEGVTEHPMLDGWFLGDGATFATG